MSYEVRCGDVRDKTNYHDLEMKFDLIFMDPPFKPMKQKYKQRSDAKEKLDEIETPKKEEWNQFFIDSVENVRNLLKPSGFFCIKCDSYTSRVIFALMEPYFDWKYTLIWDKCSIGLGWLWRKQHEEIEVYVNKDAQTKDLFWDQPLKVDNGKWHGGSQDLAFSSIIKVPYRNNGTLGKRNNGILNKDKKQKHINETPIGVFDKIIRYMTPKNAKILDLCAGRGSLGKKIKELNEKGNYNRSYIAMEKEMKYVRDIKMYFSPELDKNTIFHYNLDSNILKMK
jgi:DNA modification methylase